MSTYMDCSLAIVAGGKALLCLPGHCEEFLGIYLVFLRLFSLLTASRFKAVAVFVRDILAGSP